MEEHDLLQCVEVGLDGYGSSVKNAFFWRTSILHNSNRSEIMANPALLSLVLKETFGSDATKIEASIISEIKKKFNLSQQGECSLADAINDAKKQISAPCDRI